MSRGAVRWVPCPRRVPSYLGAQLGRFLLQLRVLGGQRLEPQLLRVVATGGLLGFALQHEEVGFALLLLPLGAAQEGREEGR